jgi:hypothetical protein
MSETKVEPTVIRIEGPAAGFKSTICLQIERWAATQGERVYINEENGAYERGPKSARFHIYTKQT